MSEMIDWHSASEATDPPLPAYEENGRLYHGSYKGVYPTPCDEFEGIRLHLLHQTIRMARRVAGIPGPCKIEPKKYDYRELHAVHFEGLFWADEKCPRVLDLGCGTGIWALEMARWYPNIVVVGIDIVNIYPDRKECPGFPSNCFFQKGPINFESDWGMGPDHWSFIRGGLMCGSVTDWPELYKKIRYHLKPGYGIFEQVEIDLRPRCDDGSLPLDPEYPLNKWYQLLAAATAKTGRSFEYNLHTTQLLKSAGFVDVQDYAIQLPLDWHGDWPPTTNGDNLAKAYHACLVGDQKQGGYRDSGLESMSLATFTRELGWTLKQWIEFEEQIIHAFTRPDVQVYHVLHIITARKPNKYESSSQSP